MLRELDEIWVGGEHKYTESQLEISQCLFSGKATEAKVSIVVSDPGESTFTGLL